MKTRNFLAVAILCIATISSLVALVLCASQLRPEHALTAVQVDTAIISQLNGLRSAVALLRPEQQEEVLRQRGVPSIAVLEKTIASQNADFEKDLIARHAELERRDRTTAVLMTIAAFSAAACAMGTMLLTQAFRTLHYAPAAKHKQCPRTKKRTSLKINVP